MSIVHFGTLDLNLMKVLMVLLARRSVTAAAAELALTPSAVSHALGRLRTALNDPLFERRAGTLVPTPYALEVGRRARPALEQLRGAIAKLDFEPATEEREFTLAAGTYAAAVLLPNVLARLQEAAPRVLLRVKRIEAHYVEDVENRRVDVALGVPHLRARKLKWRPILTDSVVWAARREHPFLREPLTGEMLKRAKHIVLERFESVLGAEHEELRRFLDVGAELRDAYDAALESERQTSSPVAIVSDMGHALEIVRRSDFVTLTLRGFADALARSDLQVLTPPHPAPAIEIGAIYHPDRLRDPGFVWLLNLLTSA